MKKDESTDRNDRYRCTIFYFVSGFSFLISIIALCSACISKSVVIEKESIVLVFIGLLSTFIVVGNFAQVKSIEQDFAKKVDELKKDFSEQANDLKLEFDKKVFINQNFQEIKEIYKEMAESIGLVEKLLSTPNNKRSVLYEEGKKHLNGYSILLKINKFVLPTDLFIMFEEVEGLLSDCFNNNIFITSTNENNMEAEQRIIDKINSASIKINELKSRIDELLKLKYAIN